MSSQEEIIGTSESKNEHYDPEFDGDVKKGKWLKDSIVMLTNRVNKLKPSLETGDEKFVYDSYMKHLTKLENESEKQEAEFKEKYFPEWEMVEDEDKQWILV